MQPNILLAITVLLGFSSASPTGLKEIERSGVAKKEGSYIVTLTEGASKARHFSDLRQHLRSLDRVVYKDWSASILHGYSAQLGAGALDHLRGRPDVASIEEDGVVNAAAVVTQANAPWGLQRISQRAKISNATNPAALTFTYRHDSAASGSGVDVYVIDTGIYTAHSQFGGRARWGATFGGYPNQDGNGHGTHVAGTVGGSQVGVAKAVGLIAVKVLSDAGSGTTSDIIASLNWVSSQAQSFKRPSVVTLSLGGGASTALDNAVNALIDSGVHVVVAAGNENQPISGSPARVPAAITVGASTISDTVSSASNYGPLLDLYAPGQLITSTWIGSPTALNTISGSSSAVPHVAGLIAYFIALIGNQSPADMAVYLARCATKNALSGVPANTNNWLAYNCIV